MTGMWIIVGVLLVIVAGLLIVIRNNNQKANLLQRKQKQYHDIVNQSLETFAHAIDAKDQNTNGHSERVAIYSAEIARRMGMSDEEQEQIYYMGMLHDIGKIGIPDAILKKTGKTNGRRNADHTKPSYDRRRNFTGFYSNSGDQRWREISP